MRACLVLLVAFVAAPFAVAQDAKPLTFRLTFEEKVLAKPFTGRVFVLLSNSEPRPIVRGLNWFRPEPGFAKDITDWKPGTPLNLDKDLVSHPTPLDKLKPGKYWVQAVIDRDLGGIDFSASPGNLFSKAVRLELDPASSGTVELKIDQVYEDRQFKETDTVKLFEMESPSLTKFHGKPSTMRAGVILPPSYGETPNRKYPVVYEIMGFGGNHFSALGIANRKPGNVAGVEMLWVILDANCRLGHHVFADSANNGPVGTALVEEFIPALEQKFRGIGQAGARFVTGHSSGGWSSLWLQVAYPKSFNGCWSTSPDPVDFHDFQRIDLYDPKANMFVDAKGERRPIARNGNTASLFYQPFSDMEVLMGRGGQLGSFEAVFSPKGKDGKPLELWNRKTGEINRDVVKAWEKYDIRGKLEREWKDIGPQLAGKLHVYMGELDTFYLEGATKLLKKSLTDLKSDAVVELFPGRTHGLVDQKLRLRMNAEMTLAYLKWDMSKTP